MPNTNDLLLKYTTNTDGLITKLEAERVERQKRDFNIILNEPALNVLNHITSSAIAVRIPKTKDGIITVKRGDVEISLTLKIKDTEGDRLDLGIEPSTQKLFTLVRLKYTQEGRKDITIPLKEYMDVMGVSKADTARKKIKEDIETLYSMDLKILYGKQANKNQLNARFFERMHYEGGKITLTVTDTFAKVMQDAKEMPYPKKLLQIPCNPQKNPYVFAMGNLIYERLKMDAKDKKTGENKDCTRLAVKTLLEVCYINGMKKPEDLRQEAKEAGKKPRLTQFIILPFENTLNVLEAEGLIKYHYCYPKGELIPAEILEKTPNFEEWISRSIEFTYSEDYPREWEHKPAKKSKKVKKG